MVALATTSDLTRFGYTPPANAAALLDRASARIRLAAGHQSILAGTSTATFPASPERELKLWQKPVQSVTSVVRDDSNADITADCILDGDTLVLPWYGGGGYLYPSSAPFWHVWTSVTVTYVHGFAIVPDELLELTCAVAMRLAGTKPDRDMAISSWTVGDISQTINPAALLNNAGLLPSEEATIRRIFFKRG